jgi:hypothetical protein
MQNVLGGEKVSQTKLQSLKETLSNTFVGMLGSWLIVIACIKNIPDPYIAATTSTILCTFWSIGRGYVVRRYFNRKTA